jgi:hypothetical protein
MRIPINVIIQEALLQGFFFCRLAFFASQRSDNCADGMYLPGPSVAPRTAAS